MLAVGSHLITKQSYVAGKAKVLLNDGDVPLLAIGCGPEVFFDRK